MFARSSRLLAASLGLALAAGCLYPVGEKVDRVVCDLAVRPHDVSEPVPVELPAAMPPAQGARPLDPHVTPVGYQTPGGPGAGQQTGPPGTGGTGPGGSGQTGTAQSGSGKTGGSGKDAPIRPQTPGPGGQGPESAAGAPAGGTGGGLAVRLNIPPGLPGASAPPINLRGLTPEQRREALTRLYAPLEPVGPDVTPAPGPDGRPLTLADLQRLALTNSPLIKQAAASVESARGAAIQAGLPPNPTVGYEADTIGTSGGPGYQGFFVEQVIKTANKLQLARAAATMDLMNAEVALRRAETDLLKSVRSAYFGVLVAREGVRVNRDLVLFTNSVYQIQVEQAREGGIAAPYEPLQLRALAVVAQTQLVTARNSYVTAWKQLAAALGLPGMPPTELAGKIDNPLPVFDHAAALAHVLRQHTDVRTAENTILKARYNLKLAQVTPVGDVDVRLMAQRDYTGPPFNVTPSVVVSTPVPVWDRNQGGIIQAQAQLVSAVDEPHRVRDDLTGRLADAFGRYDTNRRLLAYYREQILPAQVQFYRGLYERHRVEMPAGPGLPPAASPPPGFADIVVGQQNLVGSLATYLTTLGAAWQAVVDVADLLQTDDLFRVGGEVVPTECVALPELPALPCCHPCSPLPDPRLKRMDGTWPPPMPAPEAAPQMPSADEPRRDAPPAEPRRPDRLPDEAPAPPLTQASYPAPSPPRRTVPDVDPRLLEPPPPLPRR
jgi:cobalt-zinc-cadmium efflux system outer membrane protein